jgi:hypothetical protein
MNPISRPARTLAKTGHYLLIDDRITGPFSREKLLEKLSRLEICYTTGYAQPDDGAWQPVSVVLRRSAPPISSVPVQPPGSFRPAPQEGQMAETRPEHPEAWDA